MRIVHDKRHHSGRKPVGQYSAQRRQNRQQVDVIYKNPDIELPPMIDDPAQLPDINSGIAGAGKVPGEEYSRYES